MWGIQESTLLIDNFKSIVQVNESDHGGVEDGLGYVLTSLMGLEDIGHVSTFRLSVKVQRMVKVLYVAI